MTRRIGEHAVVLGAGVGGLLAARVLADSYDRVTVVERDQLPHAVQDRRGVPQSRHAHALLPSGAHVMDELLPGLLELLVANGIPVLTDYARRSYFAPAGHLLSPQLSGLPSTYMTSRPFLEAHIRDRVRGLPTVDIRDGHDVIGLTTGSAARVTGVRIQRRDAPEETLAADLVVDCLGRGSRAPAWLAELGHPRPAEEQVPVQVRYVSTRLRLRPDAIPEILTFVGAVPERPSTVAFFACDNDTWQFSVSGHAGHHPTPDLASMIEFAAACVPPHIVTALREAQQVMDVATFAYPASRWRRYERLPQFPEGLLVFGDAICSFNPVYGQGMSVAALQAAELRRCLAAGEKDLAKRFFSAAARPIDVAWKLSAVGDLALPQIEAPRPLPVRLINTYMKRLLTVAEHDPVVAEAFLRVNMLLAAPPSLMRPAIMTRVLTGGRKPSQATPQTPAQADEAAATP